MAGPAPSFPPPAATNRRSRHAPAPRLDGPFVNEAELRVVGLSRSGNHAVVHWILAQARGRVCFLNCCEGKQNPFATARPMGDGQRALARGMSLDLRAERAGRHARKDWLVYSHEDSFLAHACSELAEERHDEWIGPSRRRHDVLVLRDPFNLLASRLRAGRDQLGPGTTLRIWKQHARAALDRARLRHEPVVVLYDHWFTDREYRRALAERLDLHFTDAGRLRVCATHGGSSFDGLAFDGRADRMRVLERWRAFARDPSFRALFDEETYALAERVFGRLPAIDGLRVAE